jgi:type IV secretion system protein TrbE
VSVSVQFFYEHLHWNFITKYHQGVVIQKNGNLQRTFEYRAPDVDSSGASEVNTLALRVNDFAKRLGSGWAFHLEAQRCQIQDYPKTYFDTLAPYLVDREREASFKSAGRHFESVYFITFTWRPPSESVKKLTEMFIQSGSSSGEGSSIKQNVEFFVNETNSVIGLLASDLWLKPLDNEETVMYLHSTVSFYRHPIRFNHTQILLDRILPDCELDNSIPMKLGEKYIPIVGINDFPDESYPAILDSLNRARLEYRWVTRYICLDKEEGKKEAQKKEKHHRGSRTTFLQTFLASTSGETAKTSNHGASVKESDSIDAYVDIENDEAALGYLTTCVIVWDSDLKKAMKKADIVRTIINSKGFTCVDEKYSALESWKSSLPGQVYANFRALPVMTGTMSHVVPLSSVWTGYSHNEHAYQVTGVGAPHVICSTVEGTPFFLNLNVGDVGHSAIWGPTGAGKSTLLNLLEIQAFKYPGSLVIVFDKGRSCRQVCLAAGGLFFEPAADNAAGVNLQPLRDLETDRDIIDAIDFIESCIIVKGENVPPAMSAAIKSSIESMIEIPFEHRTLTTFIQYISYKDPDTGRPVINELLGDYLIGGKYGKIFDASSSGLSTDTRFLAVEMEALMNRGEDCVVPALVYLFNLIEKKFDGRLTFLFLDEAWLFLKNKKFSEKITEWLKVLRKKNVYVIFATQDVADVANSPLKTTIIQQCLTKIYLADPSANTASMTSYYIDFGLTVSEISLIASAAMKRDYFYTSPAGKRLFQLDLGQLTLSLIGTPNHTLLDELASAYEPGNALCSEILTAKGFDYARFLEDDYPVDPQPLLRQKPVLKNTASEQIIQKTESSTEEKSEITAVQTDIIMPDFFDAVASLPDRKNNDGSGRAASSVAKTFNVSISTVYKIRKILKYGSQEIIDSLRNGSIPITSAYKLLLKERKLEPEQAAG